jgi:diadenosine tetraphosphate (Ap4A) HIT family hydrolase
MSLKKCPFCPPKEDEVIVKNDLAIAVWDSYPVTKMHALVVPARHAEDYFALTSEEVLACHDLLHKVRKLAQSHDPSIEGFNVGTNVGGTAGQKVLHCHFHIIPRRGSDKDESKGGIRNVIPKKADELR